MKHSISMRNILTDIALAGTLLLTLISAQAMTSLVDYDHSSEGAHQGASVYTAAPLKNGGSIDQHYSAESISSGHVGPSSSKAPRTCGFLDCDHGT